MDRKRKWVKWLAYWCLPGVLAAVFLPFSGCFSALCRGWGDNPSPGEKIVSGALDVVTLPVQAVVFGTYAVVDGIDANTGKRGERKRYLREVDRYTKILGEDFGKVYEMPEFLTSTNTPAHEALYRWLSAYSGHNLPREDVERLAERLYAEPELLASFEEFLCQREMSQEMRARGFMMVAEHCREQEYEMRDCHHKLRNICRLMSDADLAACLSSDNDAVDQVLRDVLTYRAKRRENERKRKEEREAQLKREAEQRKAEEAARRQREEECRAEEAKRVQDLQGMARRIDGPLEEFRPALDLRGEFVVAEIWNRRLLEKSRPLPAENVRLLAEAALLPGEEEQSYCYALFRRPELTEGDLRAFYPKMLAKIRKGGEERMAAGMVKNPNFPADLVQVTYDEPLLVDLRVTYLVHRVFPQRKNRAEMDAFDKQTEELAKEWKSGRISFEKYQKARFELTSKYLPKECPEDWVKAI